ncbi:MAG: TonB-dependent receptor plug domain-containing protein [Gammaproteobacteria bacterium]
MKDQKATRIKDALENVSGVRPNSSLGSGNCFIVRGFSTGGKLYRNGLLATSPSGFRTEFGSRASARMISTAPSEMPRDRSPGTNRSCIDSMAAIRTASPSGTSILSSGWCSTPV